MGLSEAKSERKQVIKVDLANLFLMEVIKESIVPLFADLFNKGKLCGLTQLYPCHPDSKD